MLGADAAGALTAAVLLESRGLLQPRMGSALWLALMWSAALGSFALTHNYGFALVMLFAAGFLELSFSAIAQTLVQLNAPTALRGHVIGVFVMASMGLRAFSGIFVGLLGGVLGIHAALALAATALALVVLSLILYNARAGHTR
jgi:hypothetical protein